LRRKSCSNFIKLQSVSPGAVTTEFLEASNFLADPTVSEQIKKLPFLKSEDIADSVLYVLSTPPHVQVKY
jgi:NADP+-dependent farnesol dehydrogenase